MILEKYRGQVMSLLDLKTHCKDEVILLDVDTAGILYYDLGYKNTYYLPFSVPFQLVKDGKPEDRKDED